MIKGFFKTISCNGKLGCSYIFKRIIINFSFIEKTISSSHISSSPIYLKLTFCPLIKKREPKCNFLFKINHKVNKNLKRRTMVINGNISNNRLE